MAAKVLAMLALVVATGCDVMDREIYDDTPGDMALMYPEQSYVDSMEEPASTSRPLTRSSHARNMEQYKMLQALRNHYIVPSLLSVPKWIQTGTVLVPPGDMHKRSAGEQARPRLLRWKIKKGKAGSHMICYFKLCSFRRFS